VEIQESASLQLGSDVTKFRVVAAEVGRHFVSSYERRDFARGYISHIAHTARYICASLLSAFLFLLLSLVFFFFFSTGGFRVAARRTANSFRRPEQIEISSDYSIMTRLRSLEVFGS